ncbi:MAG: type 4a pilus biogenesis protein PilO [Tepidanaerobacteraceae bacterium]
MIKYPVFLKKNSTKREKGLIFLIVMCLVLYAIHSLLAPKIGKLNSLKSQLIAVNNERASYEQSYNKYHDYDSIMAEYDNLKKKVPIDNDLSKFIRDIENWCQHSDITIISIVPQETKTEQIEEIEVNLIPCEITIRGNFDLLLTFVDKLENYHRICRINEIKLTGLSERNSSPSLDWKLTINVGLYYIPPIT